MPTTDYDLDSPRPPTATDHDDCQLHTTTDRRVATAAAAARGTLASTSMPESWVCGAILLHANITPLVPLCGSVSSGGMQIYSFSRVLITRMTRVAVAACP
jgi:hypothetical protein